MIKPPTSNLQHLTLLMITRKVDKADASPAGFTYNWVKKISSKLKAQSSKLYVICQEKGDITGLEDVRIYSLGKEKGFSKLRQFLNFQILALRLVPQIDGIFCHQNPEYTILIAPYAKLFRKKIITWYTHKQVSWKLHLVNLLADKILTASEESCRLKNRKKIVVTGHGIDVDFFKPNRNVYKEKNNFYKILSVGRISPVKDYETLIKAVRVLVSKKSNNPQKLTLKSPVLFQIIGAPALERDKKYLEKLKNLVKRKKLENYIKFLGPVPHNQILPYYQNCDLFINLSQTGSVDKAVLEAMACEKLVITCNEAFVNILNDKRLLFEPKNPYDLARKIVSLLNLSFQEKQEITKKLRKEVIEHHNLDKLIDKIIRSFYT